MKLRKINVKVLFLGGFGYRGFIILCNTIFFYFGLKQSPWRALQYALVWNAINTGLYFLWHYWFIRLFKYGKESKNASL